MSNPEAAPLPQQHQISDRKLNMIGLSFIGGVFAVSYVGMGLVPYTETPNQDNVRACAELLDAPELNLADIKTKCDSDIISANTTKATDGSRIISTVYPTGDHYKALAMPEAIVDDANRPDPNNVIGRSIGAFGVTVVVFGGLFGYNFYQDNKQHLRVQTSS